MSDVTIHACPEGYAEVMPCCHLPPSERHGDRITTTSQFVTCGVDEPFVLDVDGNPIRPGQLVEFSYAWDRTYRSGDVWRVEAVHPQDRTLTRFHCVNDPYPADKFTAITDTFRPPEPDARTTNLMLTVRTPNPDPDETDAALAEEVRRTLLDNQLVYRDSDLTVEVVASGRNEETDE